MEYPTERKKSLFGRIEENPKKYVKRAIFGLALLSTLLYGRSCINDRERIDAVNNAVTNSSTIEYVNDSPDVIMVRACGLAEGLTEKENIDTYVRRVVKLNNLPIEQRFDISKGEHYELPTIIQRNKTVSLPDVNRDGTVGCDNSYR